MFTSEKKSLASTFSLASEEVDEPTVYTEGELNAMRIADIKSLATDLGYTITKTTKAEIIAEFLSQQNSNPTE